MVRVGERAPNLDRDARLSRVPDGEHPHVLAQRVCVEERLVALPLCDVGDPVRHRQDLARRDRLALGRNDLRDAPDRPDLRARKAWNRLRRDLLEDRCGAPKPVVHRAVQLILDGEVDSERGDDDGERDRGGSDESEPGPERHVSRSA